MNFPEPKSNFNSPIYTQPFSQDYGLASHTPLMLYALILYVTDGTYTLTSTSDDKFLRNFFMAGVFTLRVFVRNLVRGYR